MTRLASSRSILLFALQVLVFSVALFAAWYYATPVSAATAWGAGRIAAATDAIERAGVKVQGRQATFEVEPDHETLRRNRLPGDALVDVPVNPLKHTFGLPFFLALLLASRPTGMLWKAPLGSLVVVVLAAVSLACELLVQVGLMRGAGGEPLFLFGSGWREAMALGFQLGTLIFPTVVPAMLWAWMDRETLRQFLPARRQAA